jgi:hypothetical protein
MTLRYIVGLEDLTSQGLEDLTSQQQTFADANADGGVSIPYVVKILRIIVGEDSPIECNLC